MRLKKIYTLTFLTLAAAPWLARAAAVDPLAALKEQGERIYGGDGTPLPIAIILANVFRIVLSFVGIVFLVLAITAAISWMTAGGNEEKIVNAKKKLTNAAIGLTIVFSAYIVAYWITYFIRFSTSNRAAPEAFTEFNS